MKRLNKKMLFGCVADDYTGATDEACMIKRAGLSVGLFLGIPMFRELRLKSRIYDSIIIGVQTRSIEQKKARAISKKCFELLKKIEVKPVQFKYCSTFDSTEKGNIGPVIEEGLKCFKQKMTIAVPALPVNKRTTYMGYHFVGDKLLSESHMRHHPLNPMYESNLIKFLSKQTTLKVGLADIHLVREGQEKLKEYFRYEKSRGINILIVDCIEDKDLEIIMSASSGLSFLSGGSGIGAYINKYYASVLGTSEKKEINTRPKTIVKRYIRNKHIGALVISGSCSTQTLKQNEYSRRNGFYKIQMDIKELIKSKESTIDTILHKAKQLLSNGKNVLISSSQSIRERKKYTNIEKNREGLGSIIQNTFADIVRNILEKMNCSKLIISGGETSGNIIKACPMNFFEVLAEIDPGVPLIYSPERCMFVVLKCGNFGTINFYTKTLKLMQKYL